MFQIVSVSRLQAIDEGRSVGSPRLRNPQEQAIRREPSAGLEPATPFLTINALEHRFPNVRAVAPASVVDRMRSQFAPDVMDGIFRRLFPGQIPDEPGIAESLDGASIELEGHPLIPIETGYTDTADSTSLARSVGPWQVKAGRTHP